MPIKVVILSLPKDQERRQFCKSELTHLGLKHEFTDAISGDQLDDGLIQRIYNAEMNRSTFKRPLSRSEVACTLGHRQIWKEIASGKNAVGLILEDDAKFVQDPRPFLDALDNCSECFENVMIKLDGVSDKNAKVLTSVADQRLILSDRLPPRTTGYIIGRRAAARLLELTSTIERPVDIYLKFYWEHNVPILTLQEQMITEHEAFASNIDRCRRKVKSGSSLKRFVKNLYYQTKYTYGRLSHPLDPNVIEGLAPLLRRKDHIQDGL